MQAYLIQIRDRSDTNFRKILDLKGIRKAEQPTLVELFGIHRDGKAHDDLVDKSPLMTPLMTTGGLGGGGGLGIGGVALGGGSNIQQRFDPTGFGEKLFSAARDGVGAAGERMGSPLGGGCESGGGGQSEEYWKILQERYEWFWKVWGKEGWER